MNSKLNQICDIDLKFKMEVHWSSRWSLNHLKSYWRTALYNLSASVIKAKKNRPNTKILWNIINIISF